MKVWNVLSAKSAHIAVETTETISNQTGEEAVETILVTVSIWWEGRE